MKQLLLLLVMLLLLAGCAQSSPETAVTAYFEALIAGEEAKLTELSCASWEAQAATQADSFRAMNPTLRDMSCTAGQAGDGFTPVMCQGAIVTDYNGETREWPLETYRVVQEDGAWRFCGQG
jgi:hypothetical protein